jgi:phage terminase large subunit
MTEITIPYTPRPWFKPLHDSKKRWIVDVAHRRAGKSVAQANHLIRAALQNKREFPPPKYAYVGPSFSQTKDLIWGYMQQYAGVIPGTRFSETELTVILPTGAKISLYGGAQAYERIRGLYLDGAVLDEMPLLHPNAFDVVVRPALADYGGFGILSGTPQGRDHFYAAYLRARENPDTWDVIEIPVTATDCLAPDEIDEMRSQMTPNQFAREMLCSFDAPVEGSYYGDIIVDLMARGQVTKVPYDRSAGVVTSWDLGIHDANPIWFIQRIGREIHVIDFLQAAGKGLDWYAEQLRIKGYNYIGHIFPHDVKARELGTGRARYEILEQLGLEVTICRDHKPEDGIAAVRSLLPTCYFDEKATEQGLICLKSYQAAPAPSLGTMHARPLHNWASHAADSFRYLAIGLDQVIGWSGRSPTVGGGMRKWALKGLAR